MKETFNRTSNQTIDPFEKNKTETEQLNLEKVWSIRLGFDADVNNAKAAFLEGRIQSGSEDPQTMGVYQATSVPDAQRRVQDLIEPKAEYMRDYYGFDEVTLHPDGTVEFWDSFINGFVRTRHPSNKQLDTLPAADAEKIRRHLEAINQSVRDAKSKK